MKYEPSLDGLRAVAVSAVVLVHAHHSLLPGGWAGVDIFFVLSGFLISTILMSEISRKNRLDLGRFYAKRALRLVPALACLLGFLLLVSLFAHHGKVEDLEDIGLAAAYLMNWNYAFNWVPGGFTGHTWSLAMEEQFYLVWPFVLMFLARRRKRAFFIILAAIAAEISWRLSLLHSGATDERTYAGFDTHSDTLLIGCAVAFAPIGPGIKAWARKLVLLPIGVLSVILFNFDLHDYATQSFGWTLAGCCAAWIMIAAMQPGMLKTLLSTRLLVYTGRISYGWYLWSYPFFFLSQHVLTNYYEKPLSIILSYIAAMLSFHYVETPFLRLKDRLTPKTIPLHEPASLNDSAVRFAP